VYAEMVLLLRVKVIVHDLLRHCNMQTLLKILSRQAHQSSDEPMLALAFIETAQRIPVAF